jgi:ribose transport system permease protein
VKQTTLDHARSRHQRFVAQAAALVRPFVALLVVVIVFFAIPPHKGVSVQDLQFIAVQTLIVGTCAIGMTLVIASGGLDLSVGSGIALAGVAAALVLSQGTPLVQCLDSVSDLHEASSTIGIHGLGRVETALRAPLLGLLLVATLSALAVGATCGLYNGLLITLLRLPPFIVTLGTLGLFRGVAKWIAGSRPISADPGALAEVVRPFPTAEWLVVAPGVWFMLVLGLFASAIIRTTVFGRRAIAIGSNELAARYAGVPINRTKVLVYVVCGLLVGLGGLFQFGRLSGQGDPTIAVGLELDIIAATVIGGASLNGGRGSILGSLVGAFMMTYMRNRCDHLQWPSFVQQMIVGHIIIAAVAVDLWRQRRSTAR